MKKDACAGVRDAAGAGAAGRGRQRGGLTAGSGRAGGPLPLDNIDVARYDRVISLHQDPQQICKSSCRSCHAFLMSSSFRPCANGISEAMRPLAAVTMFPLELWCRWTCCRLTPRSPMCSWPGWRPLRRRCHSRTRSPRTAPQPQVHVLGAFRMLPGHCVCCHVSTISTGCTSAVMHRSTCSYMLVVGTQERY